MERPAEKNMGERELIIPDRRDLKFVLLDNFTKKEISLIMRAVKKAVPDLLRRKVLVFAKSTDQSRKMTIQELTNDISEDHLYLLENPPDTTKSEI